MRIAIINMLFLCLTINCLAQSGSNDMSFNPKQGPDRLIRNFVLQPDGKIIIGGDFHTYNGTTRNFLTRINDDGSLDAAYNQGGIGPIGNVIATELLPDGKIIHSSSLAGYNGMGGFVNRINTDGTLDLTSNFGTGPNEMAFAIAIQADGKIILGGEFTAINGVPRKRIARLNTDCTLDLTFDPGFGADGTVYDILVQSDGKIIIAGTFSTYNGSSRSTLARINVDGSLDNTFNVGTGFDGWTRSLAIQPDGKIIVCGYFNNYNGTSVSNIVRLNTDGSLDTGYTPLFNNGGYIYFCKLQGDGKIIVGGDFVSCNGIDKKRLARINADGSLDAGFNIGDGFDSLVYWVDILPDSSIIVGGDFTTFNGEQYRKLCKLNSDGSINSSFNGPRGTNPDADILTSLIQSDEKSIIGGNFTMYNGVAKPCITKINTDGSIDNSFNPSGVGTISSISSLAPGVNNKIYAAGVFDATNKVVRFNSDGTNDPSFSSVVLADNAIRVLTTQSDGKILVGGDFITYDGLSRSRIARLNTDGTVDQSFNPGTGFTSAVRAIAIQSDGKLIVGGDFTFFNGSPAQKLIRLNTDGSVDNTFNIANGPNYAVRACKIQPDGKIIIAGDFDYYNLQFAYGIARLNTDGSRDFSFNTGQMRFAPVYSFAIQADGKLIVGGSTPFANSFNQPPVYGLERLNSDGSLDNYFTLGTEEPTWIYTTQIHSNNKILIGGHFSTYENIVRNNIAQLNNNIITTNSPSQGTQYCAPSSNHSISYTASGTYYSGNTFYAQLSDALGSFSSPMTIGSVLSISSGTISINIPSNVNTGTGYRIRVVSNNPTTIGTDNGYNINITKTPQVDICLVTVDSLSTHNIVIWDKPVTNYIDIFNIYREITAGNFQQITAIPYDSLNEYHDYAADPNVTSFKYKVSTTDFCGVESSLSDYHQTIHLQDLGGGNLQWNLYEIENAANPVTFYQVYRDDNSTGNFQPIELAIPGGNGTFTDPNFSLYPNSSYVVDVSWNISCTPYRTTVNTTRSNLHVTPSLGIENQLAHLIKIYPNPANKIIFIELPETINSCVIQIHNSLGQIICSKKKLLKNHKSTLKIFLQESIIYQ